VPTSLAQHDGDVARGRYRRRNTVAQSEPFRQEVEGLQQDRVNGRQPCRLAAGRLGSLSRRGRGQAEATVGVVVDFPSALGVVAADVDDRDLVGIGKRNQNAPVSSQLLASAVTEVNRADVVNLDTRQPVVTGLASTVGQIGLHLVNGGGDVSPETVVLILRHVRAPDRVAQLPFRWT